MVGCPDPLDSLDPLLKQDGALQTTLHGESQLQKYCRIALSSTPVGRPYYRFPMQWLNEISRMSTPTLVYPLPMILDFS